MATFAPWQEVDYRVMSGNPVPPYLSINLRKNILAVYVSSPTAKPTWKLAGWLNQVVTVGIPVLNGQVNIGATHLLLRKTQLIELDQSFGSYQVFINFPYWLDTVEIALWQSEKLH